MDCSPLDCDCFPHRALRTAGNSQGSHRGVTRNSKGQSNYAMEEHMPKFAFVDGDKFGKPKAVDQKVIRSHCMREKNKREVVEEPNAQWLNHIDTLAPSAPPTALIIFNFPYA